MSLEQRIAELTEVMKTFVTVIQSAGALTAQPLPTTAGPETASDKHSETKEDDYGLVEGDPAGTKYFVDNKNKTVYAQKPGDPDPGIPSMARAFSHAYLKSKATFEKKAPKKTEAVVEASAPAADPTPASKPADATAGPTWKEVLEQVKALNLSTAEGHGRPAIVELVKHFGQANVPALEALGKHAEILAYVNAKLAPAASDEDDLGI